MSVSTELVQQVRTVVVRARQAGEKQPGRPTLAKLTGASEHHVRQALAQVRQEDTEAGVAGIDSRPVEVNAGEPDQVTETASSQGKPGPARLWPLLVIGLGAAVAVWSGWVGLGRLSGFGVVQPLPGIWDGLRINTAVTLPLSVEAYASFALKAWLGSAGSSVHTKVFAKRSSIASLVIGGAAQVIYHLLVASGVHQAPWPVVVMVACVPVTTLGLAAGLAHLLSGDRRAASWS